MRGLAALKPLWILPVLFLSGCSDRAIEIIDASVPEKIYSEEIKRENWVVVVHTKADIYNSLKGDGTFTLFKVPCNGTMDGEEVGFIIENKNYNDNKWTFAIDDSHVQGNIYRGVARGDCVFMKTKPYFFSTQYKSNIVPLR